MRRLRKSTERATALISEHPIVWIILAGIVALIAVLILVLLLPPPNEWGSFTLSQRIAIGGAVVGFLGLVAAVLALVYALAEVRHVFPQQAIRFSSSTNVKLSESLKGEAVVRFGLALFVPQHAPIVNAYRITLGLYQGNELVPSHSAQQVGFTGWNDSPESLEPRSEIIDWEGDDGGFFYWTANSEQRWFPGVFRFSPELIAHVRQPTVEEFVRKYRWKGEWWTDREGPEPFDIGYEDVHPETMADAARS